MVKLHACMYWKRSWLKGKSEIAEFTVVFLGVFLFFHLAHLQLVFIKIKFHVRGVCGLYFLNFLSYILKMVNLYTCYFLNKEIQERIISKRVLYPFLSPIMLSPSVIWLFN